MPRLLPLGLLLSLAACGESLTQDQEAFNAELTRRHGEDVRVVHAFIRDSLHLQLLIDGAAFHQVPDSAVVERAQEVADLALEHWDPQLTSDSLTIRFVRFLPEAGASYCGARSVTFRLDVEAPDLAGRRVFERLDISRTPCP